MGKNFHLQCYRCEVKFPSKVFTRDQFQTWTIRFSQGLFDSTRRRRRSTLFSCRRRFALSTMFSSSFEHRSSVLIVFTSFFLAVRYWKQNDFSFFAIRLDETSNKQRIFTLIERNPKEKRFSSFCRSRSFVFFSTRRADRDQKTTKANQSHWRVFLTREKAFSYEWSQFELFFPATLRSISNDKPTTISKRTSNRKIRISTVRILSRRISRSVNRFVSSSFVMANGSTSLLAVAGLDTLSIQPDDIIRSRQTCRLRCPIEGTVSITTSTRR